MLASFLLLAVAGCATPPEEVKTASELYAEATDLNNGARYEQADDKYQELVSTYPTSVHSQQALLDQIYSLLNRREYARSVDTADEFISLYPDHEQVDYAMYMKGVVFFREDRGLLDRLGRQDPSRRDPRLMRRSFEVFSDLIESFPESRYLPDAVYRLRYLINSLAKSEIHIANFYFKHEMYPAVIDRAKGVLNGYPDSTSTEPALVLLMRSYERLGVRSAAQEAREMLELNFPANTELQEAAK